MRKVLSVFIAICLVLLLGMWAIAPPPAASAVGVGVWYVDPTGTDDGTHGIWTGASAFLTIQYAINDSRVLAGDTINVAAGTYTEIGQLHITKNLTIVGADKATTIIKPNADTAASGDAGGWWLVDLNVQFNLSEVTLDGTGKLVSRGIRHKGSGTIQNVYFTHLQYEPSGPLYGGFAIYAFTGYLGVPGAVNVTDCQFDNIGREGVVYYGAGTTGTYHGNTYTGKGPGTWIDYGVEVTSGAVATITDSTFTDCEGYVDTWDSAGIAVLTLYAPGTTATITGSTFTGNRMGIGIGADSADTSVVHAHGNTISGNDHFGAENLGTNAVFDATDNWWGSASGPYQATTNQSGTGNAVSANVAYNPWLGAVTTGFSSNAYVCGVGSSLEIVNTTIYGDMSNYDVSVLADALVTLSEGFSVPVTMHAVYNGTPVGVNYTLPSGVTQFWISSLFGGTRTRLIDNSGRTDVVEIHVDSVPAEAVGSRTFTTTEVAATDGNFETPANWTDTLATASTTVLVVNEWYVAKTGLDTNPGTAALPFLTIQHAISIATAGNTINVAAGTYTENLTIAKALTLQGAAGSIISVADGPAVTITADTVTVDGFEIVHTSGPNDLLDIGIYLNQADHCTIAHNNIHLNAIGIEVLDSASNTIHGNAMTSNVVGLYFEGTTESTTDGSNANSVTDNTISGSFKYNTEYGHGIYLDAACNSNIFTGNTVTGNAGDGIYAWKAAYNTYTGNTVTGNGGAGIQLYGSSNNTITGNTITGNLDGLHIRNIDEASNPPYSIRNNVINRNKIYGNTRVNLYASPNFWFDVTGNWWGSDVETTIVSKIASWNVVPDLVQPGTTVFINYAPWYSSEAMTQLHAVNLTIPAGTTFNVPAGTTLVVDGTLTIGGTCTISGSLTCGYLEIPAGGSLTVDSTGDLTTAGMSVHGTFTLYDSHDTLMITDDFTVESGGVVTWDNSHVVVGDGTTTPVIILVKSGATFSIINNTLVEKASGSTYYFQVENGAIFTMTDSTMTGCGVSGTGAEAGLYIDTPTVTLQHNTLSGNYIGLVIGLNATDVEVHDNTISGNTMYEIYNNRTTTLNAEYNWWGSVNGPVPAKIGGLVDYTPWSMSAGDHTGFTAALSLVPPTETRWANGETFNLTVHLDVSGVNVNAMDARITYDTDHLEVMGITWVPTLNPFDQSVEMNFATAGVIRLAAGRTSQLVGPFAVSGDVAIIQFRTKNSTAPTTPVSFDVANTFVMQPNTNDIDHPINVLTGATGATVTINDITVTFDKNLGDTEADPTTRTATYGGTVTLPTPPIRTGYTFTGWNTLANGSGTPFTESTAVTASITVYAQWAINTYQVTISGVHVADITPTSPQWVNHGSGITFTVTPVQLYYIFSTTRNGLKTELPILNRNLGGVKDLQFLNITETTTIVVNIFRRGDIAGGIPSGPDGEVGIADVSVLISQWRLTGAELLADLNCDGVVNISDLSMMMSLWGNL